MEDLLAIRQIDLIALANTMFAVCISALSWNSFEALPCLPCRLTGPPQVKNVSNSAFPLTASWTASIPFNHP